MPKYPLVMTALLSSTVLAASGLYAAQDMPIAVVNGNAITDKDYQAFAESFKEQTGRDIPAEQRPAVIERLVNHMLISQDAVKQGLDKDPKFLEKLEQQRKDVLVEFAVKHYMSTHTITDEQLKEAYDKWAKERGPQKEYKASHILVKTEEEAQAVIKDLQAGKEFAALAKEKSLDPGSAKEGGSLGWFNPKQMVPPFAEAVATMEKGKISDKPVKTDFGWHVILMEDSRESAAPPLDAVKPQLKQKLENQQLMDYVEALKKDAKIETSEKDVKVETPEAAK